MAREDLGASWRIFSAMAVCGLLFAPARARSFQDIQLNDTCPGADQEYLCGSEDTCIFPNQVCDGSYDCFNGADEVNCPPSLMKLEVQASQKILPKGTAVQVLEPGFRPGRSVSAFVSIHEGADRFAIDLQIGNIRDGDDIAIHINPRFSENELVLNSKVNGEWGVEERHGLMMTLERGRRYKVTAVCEDDGFKLYIDGQYWCSFKHRMLPSSITHMLVYGDITIAYVTYNHGTEA